MAMDVAEIHNYPGGTRCHGRRFQCPSSRTSIMNKDDANSFHELLIGSLRALSMAIYVYGANSEQRWDGGPHMVIETKTSEIVGSISGVT